MSVQLMMQQLLRRLMEFCGKWPRTAPIVGRRKIAVSVSILLVVVFYYFLLSGPVKHPQSALRQCVVEEFKRRSVDYNEEVEAAHQVSYIGNGLLAMDVAGGDGQLLLWPQSESSASATPLSTGFSPLAKFSSPRSVEWSRFYHYSDSKEGVARSISCSTVSEKCVCIDQSIYLHRTRPGALVQELRISNPSASTVDLGLIKRDNSPWESHNEGAMLAPVHIKVFVEGRRIVFGITCSSASTRPVSVRPHTEETLRFLCLADQDTVQPPPESELDAKKRVSERLTTGFAALNALNSHILDEEHKAAWRVLNSATFNISHSKAPGALNGDLIERTRYALLSSVRAPLVEVGETETRRKLQEELLSKNELCYTGHSTLLTPSKLWQQQRPWSSVQELLKTVEIWILTLEHRGCVFLLRAGAHGMAQSFVLSLVAGTFNHRRLEITLDPETDLHRHITVEHLRFGSTGASLRLEFNIDDALKPFVSVSATSTNGNITKAAQQQLYACSAGCLEAPRAIGRIPIRLAIKVTKPPTPILFVAEKRGELEKIRDTLHVAEVFDAPAHESKKIDLHKHGENTGLPTTFWVILGMLLLSFHLFLFKLLYTEWKNASSIPYTKFGKRMLLRR